MKKGIIIAFAILLALTLSLVLAGCGNDKGSSASGDKDDVNGGGGGQVYSLNQPISFGGGQFTFTSAESLTVVPKRFEESEAYTPENGKYVVVYYTFQGNAGGEKGGIDSAIFRLEDSTGESWTMSTDVSNSPASDLAGSQGLDIPGMQLWTNTEPESTLVMFDVPEEARGFSINLVRASEDGNSVVTEATVPLGF